MTAVVFIMGMKSLLKTVYAAAQVLSEDLGQGNGIVVLEPCQATAHTGSRQDGGAYVLQLTSQQMINWLLLEHMQSGSQQTVSQCSHMAALINNYTTRHCH